MSEQTAIVVCVGLVCLAFGGLLKCAHEDFKRDDAQTEVRERSRATARIECVRSGRMWLDRDDTCVPRCAP